VKASSWLDLYAAAKCENCGHNHGHISSAMMRSPLAHLHARKASLIPFDPNLRMLPNSLRKVGLTHDSKPPGTDLISVRHPLHLVLCLVL